MQLLAAMALGAAAVFIVVTGQEMPGTVASHFDGAGRANDYMSRDAYLALVVGVAVGVPGLVLLTGALLARLAPRRLNIPNRDYWLAPERREASIAYLNRHLATLAIALAALFCFVHVLVVAANRLDPPRLSSEWFMPALLGFVALSAFWALALHRRFRRPAR